MPHKKGGIGIAGLVCLVITIPCVALWDAHSQRQKLEDDFRSAGITAINDAPIGDASLAELRREWFVTINRIDPIFALEGTDPENLRSSVEMLGKQEESIAAIYPDEEGAAIREALYPIAYLSKLPELEARRSELTEADSAAVAKYASLQREAILVYEQDIRRLIDTMHEYGRSDWTLATIGGGQTTIEETIESLEKIEEYAHALRVQSTGRTKCLRRYAASCERIQDALARRASSIAEVGEAPSEHYDVVPILTRLHQGAPHFADPQSMPKVAMRSACYPESGAMLPWTTPIHGKKARRISVADDIYMHDVGSLFASNDEAQIRLHGSTTMSRANAAGVRYLYQISGNAYLCPDAGIDFGNVARVIGMRDVLEDGSIFTPPVSETMSALEKRLISGDPVSLADAREYAYRAARFVAENGITRSIEVLGSDQYDSLESAIALYREASFATDEILNATFLENNYVLQNAAEHSVIPLRDVIMARSSPSVLFLSFNSTIAQEPRFIGRFVPVDIARYHFTTYSTLRNAGMSDADIARALLRLPDAYARD